MTKEEQGLKAARLIALCSKARLPYVLEILRKSGIEVEYDPEAAKRAMDEEKAKGMSVWLKKQREEAGEENWFPTEDECITRLRNAYRDGLSLTIFGRRIGLNKMALYRYVKYTNKPSDAKKTAILEALNELGY